MMRGDEVGWIGLARTTRKLDNLTTPGQRTTVSEVQRQHCLMSRRLHEGRVLIVLIVIIIIQELHSIYL